MCTVCAYIWAMDIEWDPRKAAENLQKHGVDFADAVIALEDKDIRTPNLNPEVSKTPLILFIPKLMGHPLNFRSKPDPAKKSITILMSIFVERD